MARTLTPERQKLKQEALSLRYDYGLSEPVIMARLHVPQRTISHWVSHNSNGRVSHNYTTFVHLEGDCLEKLKDIPDNSVDCLLTDPPYSVMEDYEWDKKDDQFYHQWLSLVKTKLKVKHSGFIFFDSRRSCDFESILRHYFTVNNRIVWIRKNMSMGRVIKDRFIASYELIYYFGNRALDLPKEWGAERFDSCEFAVPQSNFGDKKLHPTQKPINLILQLVKVGSRPGDVVLDCFAGSGVTGKACVILGSRKCILIEIEPQYNNLIDVILRSIGYGKFTLQEKYLRTDRSTVTIEHCQDWMTLERGDWYNSEVQYYFVGYVIPGIIKFQRWVLLDWVALHRETIDWHLSANIRSKVGAKASFMYAEFDELPGSVVIASSKATTRMLLEAIR